jgi:hydrogenase expression/formation protein HypC
MCLAIPGKIASVFSKDGLRMARVSFNGVIKEVSIEWVPEAIVGDYVIVHAGSALTVLDKSEAEKTLDLFRQISQAGMENKTD